MPDEPEQEPADQARDESLQRNDEKDSGGDDDIAFQRIVQDDDVPEVVHECKDTSMCGPRPDLQARLFQDIDDGGSNTDAEGVTVGGWNGLLLHVESAGLIAEEIAVVAPKQARTDHIEVFPAAQIEMRFQRSIMVEDIDAFRGVVEIDIASLVTDDRRVRHRIEQLSEVSGLAHQRAVIANAFEDRVQLIEDPDIVIIGQADRLRLQDILFTQIDGIDDVEKAVQLDNGRELAVIDQYLQRIGGIHGGDLPEPSDIVEDGHRVAIGPYLFQLVGTVQDVDIAQGVYREIGDVLREGQCQPEVAGRRLRGRGLLCHGGPPGVQRQGQDGSIEGRVGHERMVMILSAVSGVSLSSESCSPS